MTKIKQVTVFLVLFLLTWVADVMESHATNQGLTGEDVTSVLQKPSLKILHIGNSYTFDAVSYIPTLISNTGADVSDLCIYRTMRAGGTYKLWYDIYNNNDLAYDYDVEKVCGGIDANILTGHGTAGDGSLFRQVLTEEQWDVIFIQQGSAYAPYYEQWTGDGPGGYLNELLSVIKNHQPNAVIGMMLVHSYASNYAGNKEQSSLERWELIAASVRQFCEDYGISLVVPYGTAIQNLRASSLNNDEDLTCDGVHCDYVIGRYTASCCYFETILSRRTGKTVLGDKTRINTSWLPDPSSAVPIDATTAPIAQKAAILALNDWYRCQNPEENEIITNINVRHNDIESERIFTLSGAELHSVPVRKGIYIRNGQKVIK